LPIKWYYIYPKLESIFSALRGEYQLTCLKLDEVIVKQTALQFLHFTFADAWIIGNLLRERLLPHTKPVVISILRSPPPLHHVLFQTTTGPGTAPDNDIWVARKARTVFRFGIPTWAMHVKFHGDEKAFAAKYGLGPEEAATYAIHGGAVPITVIGVEGVVAVVVVSGLKQDEDHAVVMEVLEDYAGDMS
jgi:uncharacterized protein (UPF0303 family)